MNRPILRLYMLVLVLFALLVAFTSRWTVFEASSLRENPLNKRALIEQERVAARGDHRRRRHCARAQRAHAGRNLRTHLPVRRRVCPGDRLLLHSRSVAPASSATATPPSAGSARATCSRSSTSSRGAPKGDEVITTLDPAAQQVALAALGGHHGAVVALVPRTGAVQVMASTPGYDPNALRTPRIRSEAQSATVKISLVNRAVQYGYAPGSTFKVVTATAAIDTGKLHALLDAQRPQRHHRLRAFR